MNLEIFEGTPYKTMVGKDGDLLYVFDSCDTNEQEEHLEMLRADLEGFGCLLTRVTSEQDHISGKVTRCQKPTRIEQAHKKVLDYGKNILEEANDLCNGARREAYGHPLDDYTRVAGMVNALFSHKLKEPFTPAEMPQIVLAMKMARQVHSPKRDNTVDMAGYAWVTQAILDEIAHREGL